MSNWEKEFQEIVGSISLGNIEKDFDGLTKDEVIRAIVGANEAATYMGRYVMQCILSDESQLPEELNDIIRDLIKITDAISNILSECRCKDCTECDYCADGFMCDDCIQRLEEDM